MTDDLPDQRSWLEVRLLARRNGLELGEDDARDLQPFYEQHQGWLATLRRVLGADEEPATVFSAEDTRRVRT